MYNYFNRLLRRCFATPRKDKRTSLRAKCNEAMQSILKKKNLDLKNFQQFHHINHTNQDF